VNVPPSISRASRSESGPDQEATNGELAEVPGVSRAESVPNLTRRFAGWLAERGEVRERLRQLEEQLRQVQPPERTRKPGPTPTAPRWAHDGPSHRPRARGEEPEGWVVSAAQ
jgi:hypothetical protein